MQQRKAVLEGIAQASANDGDRKPKAAKLQQREPRNSGNKGRKPSHEMSKKGVLIKLKNGWNAAFETHKSFYDQNIIRILVSEIEEMVKDKEEKSRKQKTIKPG